MELVLLVWAIDVLLNMKTVLGLTLTALIVFPVIKGFIDGVQADDLDTAIKSFNLAFCKKILVVLIVIQILIPNQQTIKYMGAAYLIQTTFQSDFVKESITLSQKAVVKQLQLWADDDKDIQTLVDSVDLNKTKTGEQ